MARIIRDPNNPHTGVIQVSVAPADRSRVLELCRRHVRGRDVRVARVFAYMATLSAFPAARRLGDRPTISCEAAAVQDRRSSGLDMQAAHYVPGQIYVGGQLPWDLIPKDRVGAIDHLRSAFERTHDLPTAFNRADSQSESGAKLGVRRVVYRVDLSGPVQILIPEVLESEETQQEAMADLFAWNCDRLYGDRSTLPEAYRDWVKRSGALYRDAVAVKVDRMFEGLAGGDALAFEQRQLEAAILAEHGSLQPERDVMIDSVLDDVRKTVTRLLAKGT